MEGERATGLFVTLFATAECDGGTITNPRITAFVEAVTCPLAAIRGGREDVGEGAKNTGA